LVIHLLLWYILIKFWIVTWDTRHLNLKWVKISVPILLMITYILFIRLKDKRRLVNRNLIWVSFKNYGWSNTLGHDLANILKMGVRCSCLLAQ
jgi:hypothetical protein